MYNTIVKQGLRPSYQNGPTVKFSREFFVDGKVGFVFDQYVPIALTCNKYFILQVDFGLGNGWENIDYYGDTFAPMNFGGPGKKIIKFRAEFYEIQGVNSIIPELDCDDPTGEYLNWGGAIFISPEHEQTITIKKTTSAYQSPDEIWHIVATKDYTPPTAFNVAFPGTGNPVTDPYTTYKLGGKGKGDAYIKYGKDEQGNTHTKLVKPIIFVDGIDFGKNQTYTDPNKANSPIRHGATGWDVFITGADDRWKADEDTEFLREFPTQFNDLCALGYDVMFLDFEDGADYIQRNAFVLEELIKKVNATKISPKIDKKNPSLNQNFKHENIIVGASMGGQIARYALADMERNKEEHCTRMYISFDSPQQGANIPLALQGGAWFFSEIGLNRKLWESLNYPAAKQMLIEHLTNAVDKGHIKLEVGDYSEAINTSLPPNPLRTAYMSEIANLGYPQKTQNLAISCGSKIATPQDGNFAAGANVFDYNLIADGGASFAKMDLFASSGANPFSPSTVLKKKCLLSQEQTFFPQWPQFPSNLNYLQKKIIFSASFPACLNGGCLGFKMASLKVNHDYVYPSFDNAPGCFRNDYKGLKNTLKDQIGNVSITGTGLNISLEATLGDFFPNQCFMPTQSVLDLRNPNDPTAWDWNLAGVLTKNIKLEYENNRSITPFWDFYAPDYNLRHVEIDETMRLWVNNMTKRYEEDLAKETTLSNQAGNKALYNYGLWRNRIPSINVNSGGQLRINNDAKTAFNNEDIGTRSVFETIVTGCGGATVNIGAGGSFIIGNEVTGINKTGIVRILEHSTILVQAGGLLRLVKGSQIIVEKGGKSEVFDQSTLSLFNQSKIIVEDGGEFILHKNKNEVVLKNTSQIIVEKGGKLYLSDPSGTVVINGDAHDGDPKNDSEIRIEGQLIVNGKLQINSDARLHFTPGYLLTLNEDFDVTGNGKDKRFIEIDPKVTLSVQGKALRLRDGLVEYGQSSSLRLPGNQPVAASSVTFAANEGVEKAVWAIPVAPSTLLFDDCLFQSGAYQLYIDNSNSPDPQLFYVRNSEFVDYNTIGMTAHKADLISIESSKFHTKYDYVPDIGGSTTIETIATPFTLKAVSPNPIALYLDAVNRARAYQGTDIKGNLAQEFKDLYEKKYIDYHAIDFLTDHIDAIGFAVLLNNVHDFRASQSTIVHDSYIGILSVGETNLTFDHKSGLYNNGIGASIRGGLYDDSDYLSPTGIWKTQYGRVTFDCGFLKQNALGIIGIDVLLDIDQWKTNFTRGNDFEQEKPSRFFDIDYRSRTFVNNTIPAENNYWGGGTPTIWEDYYLNHVTNGPITLSTSFFMTTSPAKDDCDGKTTTTIDDVDNAPPPVKSLVTINDKSYLLLPQYWTAWQNYYNDDNTDAANLTFAPIAALPQSLRNESDNPYTQLYIDIAKTMVSPTLMTDKQGIDPKYTETISDLFWLKEAQLGKLDDLSDNSVQAYPNPTSSECTISLPPNSYRLSISDVYGNVIEERHTKGHESFNTETWKPGVYFIQAQEEGSERILTGKLVVTKE